ncbi:methylmalonyl-CoA mutase family protein [Actinobacteria bacterium IMCC26207]|nr:methylmalonyl-CoA mutase family protein [Actinobacteria bacterium IMCC26207]
MTTEELHIPANPVRFITAASLFDGHDVSINIMRRILQSQGAEVIHLGHNRSVDELVNAAIQEDVQGIAISSYQGGHIEYFKYLIDRLAQEGAAHVRVYGGGGGVITSDEIAELHAYGVTKIFSPEDGRKLGLVGMVNSMIRDCDVDPMKRRGSAVPELLERVQTGSVSALAQLMTGLELGAVDEPTIAQLQGAATARRVPVLGITGTGGSGKSSLTDELLRRFRLDQEDKLRIAVLAIDPTRRRGGGALLGDRIRMNAIDSEQIFFRSLATRSTQSEVPEYLAEIILAAKAWGADLVIVETPGIGQGDAAILPYSDVSLYVMTPEFGASSQLEKIDMLDFADAVAINKFERRGAEDAQRDVARQMMRNREAFDTPLDELPVFGTVASRFNDDGVTALYQCLTALLCDQGLVLPGGSLQRVSTRASTGLDEILPASRSRYLAEIVQEVHAYHAATQQQSAVARQVQQLASSAALLAQADRPTEDLERLAQQLEAELTPENRSLLQAWPERVAKLTGPERATRESLSGTLVPKLSLPRFVDHGEQLRWLRSENLPGHFPFTAGVFPFKREGEDPARMFAGEGGAARTNRRFHLLAEGLPATRLSTAFDSVTLYGFDPAERPDIYGKIGNSGVSIATLDDMKVLYSGFDLCDPSTSVSMTINGPAPAVLAMFLNTAIDQRVEMFESEHGRTLTDDEQRELRAWVLSNLRGTVQADILKEDQGQNTCIFSTEFSLGLMADIAEWFVQHEVRNFYSVSISGYHIAEAGANPISQLAFTLANGFTYVESYLARGLAVDDFAPNLSFFFSNGMDPEYNVLGRVARRIWAVAMRECYGANERSQKLKYHVQTSGRSLHAQEMAFNDIRTTLQALCAINDNANSLHTNAYDEAVTTPTSESVRRALAIQMIITQEWGLSMCENSLQGSFIIEELTDLVEEAVLVELDRINSRGGVLGAMETGYQRGRIQDESMLYEHRKHDGSLPLIGVNTFLDPDPKPAAVVQELQRSEDSEKRDQIERLQQFKRTHAADRPAALEELRAAALRGDNLFEVLMDTVRHCSLGEITDTLFQVGGKYRRNV